MRLIRHFIGDESAQDLIEYTLVMAFVALASAALFVSMGGSVSGIWSSANTQLSVANQSVSQTPGPTPAPVRHHEDD